MDIFINTDQTGQIQEPEKSDLWKMLKGLNKDTCFKLTVEKFSGSRKDKTNAYFNILARLLADYTGDTMPESKALIFEFADIGQTVKIKMPNGDIRTKFVRESTARAAGMSEDKLQILITRTKELFIDMGLSLPAPPNELKKYL